MMQKMNHFQIALQLLFGENRDFERLKFNSQCEVAHCLNKEPCLKFLLLLKKAMNSNKRSTELAFFFLFRKGFLWSAKQTARGLQYKQPPCQICHLRFINFP